MSLGNYSTDQMVVTLNARILTQWARQDPPYADRPIDPQATLLRGLGGSALRFNRTLPGRAVDLYLMPGGTDAAYVQGLMNSNAVITLSFLIVSTLESAIGTNGIIVNDGERGRGGASISDDKFMFEFARVS